MLYLHSIICIAVVNKSIERWCTKRFLFFLGYAIMKHLGNNFTVYSTDSILSYAVRNNHMVLSYYIFIDRTFWYEEILQALWIFLFG